MKPYYTFGLLVSEGIKKTALKRRQNHGQTHIDLAHHLNVSPTTVYGWRKGERLPSTDIIPELASFFAQEGKMDALWFDKFIHAAEYGPPQAAKKLKNDLFASEQNLLPQNNSPVAYRLATVPTNPLPTVAPTWTEKTFIWFIQMEDRFGAKDVLMLIAFLTLWLAAWSQLRQFLNWPYPNNQLALKAGLQYSLVSLFLPGIVCLAAQTSAEDKKFQAAQRSRRALWVLRCAAAYIGYHLAMSVGLAAVIFLYSAKITTIAWLQAVIPALAMLLAYVFAQRFPLSRINDKSNSLTFSPSVDIPVLAAFVVFGPLVAFAFYFIHPYLLRPYLGSLMLLLSLALVAGLTIAERRASPKWARFIKTIPFLLALVLLLAEFILVGLIAFDWLPK